MTEKKTPAMIAVEHILSGVEKGGVLPWQQSYRMTPAIGYFTRRVYSGINRLVLPAGEYLTFKQLTKANEINGTEYSTKNYRGGKVPYYPLFYVSSTPRPMSKKKFIEIFNQQPKPGTYAYLRGKVTVNENLEITYARTVFAYYTVVERSYVCDPDGDPLPSRFDTKEVTLTYTEPQKMFDDYVARENITVQHKNGVIPSWVPNTDTITLNPLSTEKQFWGNAFHEIAHSTGASHRLNRKSVAEYNFGLRPVEECIAEITASMLCAEAGIEIFQEENPHTQSLANNSAAYVASWYGPIKKNPEKLIQIVSQAEKAFKFISGIDYSAK